MPTHLLLIPESIAAPRTRHVRRTRALASAAGLLALSTCLAACSIGIVEPSATPTTVADAGSGAAADSTTSSAADSTTSSAADHDGTDAPPSDTALPDGITRDLADSATTAVVSCTDDMTISADGVTQRIQGACGSATVSADGAVLVFDEVAHLTVTGSGNVLYIGELTDLTISGDANMVSSSGAPAHVEDSGVSNVIGRG